MNELCIPSTLKLLLQCLVTGTPAKRERHYAVNITVTLNQLQHNQSRFARNSREDSCNCRQIGFSVVHQKWNAWSFLLFFYKERCIFKNPVGWSTRRVRAQNNTNLTRVSAWTNLYQNDLARLSTTLQKHASFYSLCYLGGNARRLPVLECYHM